MDPNIVSAFRPKAPPQIIENAYTEDQYRRLLGVVRDNGPWPLILAHHFKKPEEVIAATSGSVPEGVQLTWEPFLNPNFRGYYGEGGVCLYPELEDCFYNSKFLDLVRHYYGADYAVPETYLFNIQGPTPAGGSPHLDGTVFRGIGMEDTPPWLLNTMNKSLLFQRWQAKKAQVIAWYYKGAIGGGFHYWPHGPAEAPETIHTPMWGRAVVVENEKMYHTAEACGPSSMRKPEGLDIDSLIEPDPATEGGWQITTRGKVILRIPEQEMRFLVHWGALMFEDYDDLKRTLDHRDDLTHEQAFDIFIKDLKARGIAFEVPTDPMNDAAFIGLLTRVYDHGRPAIMPPEPVEPMAA